MRRRWRGKTTLAAVSGGVLVLAAAAVTWAFRTVPVGSLPVEAPADVLLVLGTPATIHGTLTQAQGWRVEEAVREFHAGRAPYVLFTGGAASNQFVEAQVMAGYAHQLGLPWDRLLEEGRAKTTVENIADSRRMIEAHGWTRVEVISSPEHLHRAAYLMARTPFSWRVHAAPTPGRSHLQIAGAYTEEAIGTTAFRLFGTRAEPVIHTLATVQGRVLFSLRWLF